MPGRPFGQGNKRAKKLTGEQVMVIRERYASEWGCTQAKLSREYQVSIGTIASIVNGTSWQNMAGALPGNVVIDRPPVDTQETGDEATNSAARLRQLMGLPPLGAEELEALSKPEEEQNEDQ